MYADYKHSILQVSAALHRYYGLETRFDSDPVVRKWLETNRFRCVIAVLIDALGQSIIEQMKESSFFRTCDAEAVSTVFPPTTSAATVSFLSAKTPKENGWLGWNQWFEEKQDAVILFLECSQYGEEKYPGLPESAVPVDRIFDRLNRKGIKAASVWPPFGRDNACQSYQELTDTVQRLAADPDMRFVYAYWDRLDTQMHMEGTHAESTLHMLEELDRETRVLAERLPQDTGLLVLADHSQIEAQHRSLDEDAELLACLKHVPTLEPRTIAFHVKEGMGKHFEEVFTAHYGDCFRLFSHQEVLEAELFGDGEAHPRFEEFIGDYLAVAETPVQLDYIRGKTAVGSHAGGVKEEFMVPVILFPPVHRE